LEREIFHLEEERDTVKEQLQNWQQLYQQMKPTERSIQISWCDLCLYRDYGSPEQCVDCTMGSNFTYDEVVFGELNE
jgi:hypothetical protein